MALDGLADQVDEPDYRDAGSGVQRELHLAVVCQRGVRDLDEQQHVIGRRVLARVVVVAGSEHYYIGLGLVVWTYPERVLRTDDVLMPEAQGQLLR